MPQSMIVECDNVPPVPVLTATDNCDPNPVISLNEEIQAGVCDDNYSIIRTWTATDACGNSTIEIQVITVNDTTSPELAGIPNDLTVECGNVIRQSTKSSMRRISPMRTRMYTPGQFGRINDIAYMTTNCISNWFNYMFF